MNQTRRSFLAMTLAAGAGFGGMTRESLNQLAPKSAPFLEDLQAGDLLWPKLPGVFIPYSLAHESTPLEDLVDWEANRDRVVEELSNNLNMDNVGIVNELRRMTYAEFRTRYMQGLEPGQLVTYGASAPVAVGHVGVVEIGIDGLPYVIDAMPAPGVAVLSYTDWLAERPGYLVWQGRLKGVAAEDRAKLPVEARTLLGRPYDFWNFNLADDRGFYCSKLIWLIATRALQIAIDGNDNPSRPFWLSPKQILYSEAVEIVLDQGDYAFD